MHLNHLTTYCMTARNMGRMTVWYREGHGTGDALSISCQYFLGVRIISDVNYCNLTWVFSHILLYMLQHHTESQEFKGINFAFISHKIRLPIIKFIWDSHPLKSTLYLESK
jgi:hypothetical protein